MSNSLIHCYLQLMFCIRVWCFTLCYSHDICQFSPFIKFCFRITLQVTCNCIPITECIFPCLKGKFTKPSSSQKKMKSFLLQVQFSENCLFLPFHLLPEIFSGTKYACYLLSVSTMLLLSQVQLQSYKDSRQGLSTVKYQ